MNKHLVNKNCYVSIRKIYGREGMSFEHYQNLFWYCTLPNNICSYMMYIKHFYCFLIQEKRFTH